MLLGVICFLANLRFRKDIPLNSTIKSRYGQPLVSAYRHLQKTRLRRDKSVLDVEFLTACKVGGIIPKFLYFKCYHKNFSNTKLYRSFLFKLLNYEIKRKLKIHSKLNECYQSELESFKEKVSWLDFKILCSINF